MTIRHPPGRVGRVWLRERLQVAHRAAELLERKQAVLTRERRRLATLTEQTAHAWTRAYEDTRPPLLRLLLLGGPAPLDRALMEAPAARAQVQWQSTTGVTYPGRITTVLGAPPDLSGPSPLGTAIAAHRAALAVALEHAAASTALDRVDAELERTSQRLRAVHERLLPDLEAALHALGLSLAETERAESSRTRRAQDGSTDDARGASRA